MTVLLSGERCEWFWQMGKNVALLFFETEEEISMSQSSLRANYILKCIVEQRFFN